MHKSVIIGLLLLTAGLFGVATTLNIIISHALAQEYDKYGDSHYSQYPTDDKKYECRTGPFEGFFVSSVEFCKQVKFDKDRKDLRDNRTGTQGPQGPQGIQGPQGPPGPAGGQIGPQGIQGEHGPQGERGLTGATGMTGPAGSTGTDGEDGIQGERGFNGTQGPPGPSGIVTLNDTNTYIVRTDFKDVNVSSDESVVAICDPEDPLITGGYEIDTDPGDRFQIKSDVQFPFPPTNRWLVNIQNIGDDPLEFVVYATCFDNLPAHIP
jgi:hypothetical protein